MYPELSIVHSQYANNWSSLVERNFYVTAKLLKESEYILIHLLAQDGIVSWWKKGLPFVKNLET